MLRAVTLPDVAPSTLLASNPDAEFSMTMGDFLEIYNARNQHGMSSYFFSRVSAFIWSMDSWIGRCLWISDSLLSNACRRGSELCFFYISFSLSSPLFLLAGQWDAIVTCFFIDTAPNVFEYIETIYRLLRPGGYWINLGTSCSVAGIVSECGRCELYYTATSHVLSD